MDDAGITGFEVGVVPHDPQYASPEDWRAVYHVNLKGTFPECRYAISAKMAGYIINVSLRSGMVGMPAAALDEVQ